MRMIDPSGHRPLGLLSYLELHRSMRLTLHDHGARQNAFPLSNVTNSKVDQVTTAQLAVYGKVDKCQASDYVG